MATKDNTALRKRTQISRANKTMFITVAIVSVVIGLSAVLLYFMVNKLIFNQKVLAKKAETNNSLQFNIDNIDALKDEVRALDSNEALLSARANQDDSALQVILDSLPSESNALALGASIQNRLLEGVSGIEIKSIDVESEQADGEEATDVEETPVEDEGAEGGNGLGQLTFSFEVEGSEDAIYEVLKRLERSIRFMDISTLTIESREGKQALRIEGKAYYQPSKEIVLKKEKVSPDEKN